MSMVISLILIVGTAVLFGFLLGRWTAPKPPHCTGGASSIIIGHQPATTWYPKGCAIYPQDKP